ncbi:hypothetical protein UP10_14475 [Bradyrhizobium sp. LTSPM299]|uniref:hypothetical protein n=1 Tax=Bradyrhizobium sp. LTSPM299 TaxID=1619233 RepID=UPI0005C97520|nr:hypothetical protein [Bradyrhizobium sp. LTSPM299]KJC59898.1 hypothetical protein UP10_14475 [Bradyrhizobium sp. LTSPM299]
MGTIIQFPNRHRAAQTAASDLTADFEEMKRQRADMFKREMPPIFNPMPGVRAIADLFTGEND